MLEPHNLIVYLVIKGYIYLLVHDQTHLSL